MKKLSAGFVINLITWAVILAAAIAAVCVFNKFTAAKSALAIFRAQNAAAAKNIPATPAADANAMPEQTSDMQENNIPETQENIAAESESSKPEEAQEAQESSSYTYSDYETICKDSYDGENKKYVFKQYYMQDQPFEENGIKYKNIFYAAAAKHDNDLLKCLLEGTQKTVKVFNNIVSDDIKEQIKNAITNNNKEELRVVLKDNPMALSMAVDISGAYFHTPLSFAVKQNNKEIAEFLLEQGANIEGHSWDCGTYSDDQSNCERDKEWNWEIIGFTYPLQEAVNNKELEIVKFLVAKGANVNSSILQSTEGEAWEESSLRTALMLPNKDIAKYLIENGAKSSRHIQEYLPMDLIRNQDMEALEIMHSFGFDWNGMACFEGGECRFYFEFAVETKDKKFIEDFLSRVDGSTIQKKLYGLEGSDSFYEMICSLMESCCRNRDIVKLIFDKGIIETNQRCAPNSWKYPNKTMLMFLQEKHPEETELIEFLIQKGAKSKGNPEDLMGQIKDVVQWSPHHYKYVRIQDAFSEINSLIENGADINLKDKYGKTALDYAVTQEMKDFLISIGAKNEQQEAEENQNPIDDN
jgi:ankyrin repeat protein